MYRTRTVVIPLCRQLGGTRVCQPIRHKWKSTENRDRPLFEMTRGKDPWDISIKTTKHLDSRVRDWVAGVNQVAQHFLDRYDVSNSGHGDTAQTEVKSDKKAFRVEMDVREFDPDQIAVALRDDRLVISAKHSQKADAHGFIAREITREFLIPEDLDHETLNSVVTDEGMLVVQGRVKGYTEQREKVINIQRQPPEQD